MSTWEDDRRAGSKESTPKETHQLPSDLIDPALRSSASATPQGDAPRKPKSSAASAASNANSARPKSSMSRKNTSSSASNIGGGLGGGGAGGGGGGGGDGRGGGGGAGEEIPHRIPSPPAGLAPAPSSHHSVPPSHSPSPSVGDNRGRRTPPQNAPQLYSSAPPGNAGGAGAPGGAPGGEGPRDPQYIYAPPGAPPSSHSPHIQHGTSLPPPPPPFDPHRYAPPPHDPHGQQQHPQHPQHPGQQQQQQQQHPGPQQPDPRYAPPPPPLGQYHTASGVPTHFGQVPTAMSHGAPPQYGGPPPMGSPGQGYLPPPHHHHMYAPPPPPPPQGYGGYGQQGGQQGGMGGQGQGGGGFGGASGVGGGPVQVIHTDDAATKLSDRVRRRCFNCCTTDTSTWRRSNLSPGKVLCNKCGLFERTHSRPRPEQFPHKRGPLATTSLQRRTPPSGSQSQQSQAPSSLPPPPSSYPPPPGQHLQLSNGAGGYGGHTTHLPPIGYGYSHPPIAPLGGEYGKRELPGLGSWGPPGPPPPPPSSGQDGNGHGGNGHGHPDERGRRESNGGQGSHHASPMGSRHPSPPRGKEEEKVDVRE